MGVKIMKLKKSIAIILALTLLASGLTACGGTKSESTAKDSTETGENITKDSSATSAATDGKAVITLGVVGSVYEELWAPAKDKLAKEGIELKIQQFSDYTTPNNALSNGEIDLNAFQHQIYLNTEIENYKYKIEPIGYTFIIPLNLYSNKVKSVSEIKAGDTIAIPNDVTNGGRALKVLEAAGLITFKKDTAFSPRIEDIEKYNVKIEIKELAANTIPSALDDVTAAIINGNYALDFGLKTDDAIFADTSLNEKNYWNLIAARSSDLEDKSKVEIYKKVVGAFQTSDTETVFKNKYGGYFVSVGWDTDFLSK
jgi:D-methionine transport system substrate-binding protein